MNFALFSGYDTMGEIWYYHNIHLKCGVWRLLPFILHLPFAYTGKLMSDLRLLKEEGPQSTLDGICTDSCFGHFSVTVTSRCCRHDMSRLLVENSIVWLIDRENQFKAPAHRILMQPSTPSHLVALPSHGSRNETDIDLSERDYASSIDNTGYQNSKTTCVKWVSSKESAECAQTKICAFQVKCVPKWSTFSKWKIKQCSGGRKWRETGKGPTQIVGL